MGEQYDSATAEQTLTDGDSVTLEVDTTGRGGDVVIFVDDGTTGGTPATYDLAVDVKDENDVYRRFGSDSGVTNNSFTDPAVPQRMRYELTNASGAQATYRVNVVSYR